MKSRRNFTHKSKHTQTPTFKGTEAKMKYLVKKLKVFIIGDHFS